MSARELFFGTGIIIAVSTVHLCCTGKVSSSGLRVMRNPECEGGFICLFGHVCWAGGFYLNNSTPTYRELDLPDRDQLHPCHREWGKQRLGARDEKNHGVVKTTESLKWSGYLPCESAFQSWGRLLSRHKQKRNAGNIHGASIRALNYTQLSVGQEEWPVPIETSEDNAILNTIQHENIISITILKV